MSATVTLLAHSELADAVFDVLEVNLDDDSQAQADYLAELAGRTCYGSYHRPNPATAANADYIAHIIEERHESVLAHASATFELRGVSRALTHELVRHRWLAFSERSLRFVDASDLRPVYPPAADEREREAVDVTFEAGVRMYRRAVDDYREQGLTRKRAREAARAHLPLCTETVIVVSGNMRAWRDLFRQRCSAGADAEIRAVTLELLRQCRALAPATFADLGATHLAEEAVSC